ncbi:TonB-dependent receptor, plug [Tenacibaculum litopenaei]|uniref:TonB-dependent receptor n=1 Tax=Tenacibaculum litopenaei TaxID=396016 RepID=UPI0038952D3D
MTHSNFLQLLFVTIISLFLQQKVSAQKGGLKGIIIDESGLYLPGANVTIKSIYKGAFTDFNGQFTLVNIPAGQYDLSVSFIGFQPYTKSVTISAHRTQFLKITLLPDSNVLDEVTIATAIGGEAKALNKQQANTNITNVIATEQIGKFPDANIGDAVKRVPGITMQVDQGEARNIIIRGLAPQLNSVTLNGSRIPSAEGDNRNVQMDLIPSDMIQSIQVNKAITPDMDGDALGGSVNLVTRTAPQNFRLAATAGSGISFITNKRILNGSLLLGNRTKDKKFGWMLAGSWNDTDFGSDNIEAEWSNQFEFNNGSTTEKRAVNPYTKEFEQRNYLVQRIRRSFSVNLDYQIDPNHNLYLKTMYNWRDDRENRFRSKYSMLDGEDIAIGDFTLTNNTPTQFPVKVKRETKGGISNSRNKNRRLEDQRMQNYSLGGDHLLGALKINWLGSFSKASEERLNERYAVFKNEYRVHNDIRNSRFPLYTPVSASDANTLANFEYDEITEENKYTDETNYNIATHFTLPSPLFNSPNGFIKFGFRTRLKQKQRTNDFYEYDLESTFPTMAAVSTENLSSDTFLAGTQYQAGYFAKPSWLGALALTERTPRTLKYDEFLGDNYQARENVYAGYLMTEQQLTPQLTLLAGVRIEQTRITATGNLVNYDNDGDYVNHQTITHSHQYTNYLPGIHLKYTLKPNSILRFAFTNTLARPNYVDLVPYRNILREDGEIQLGNPNLKPAESMNFDFMAEHYFSNIGILSAGAFFKNISNFSYTYISKASDNSLGSNTKGYDVKRPQNGEDAYVLGAEVSFQRKLSFLPGFAKNFAVMTNYTFLKSKAKGINNEDGDERQEMTLPNTAPHMFNGSLSYDDGSFTARISANYSAAYIDEIGKSNFYDRYYDQQFFIDINAGYSINKNIRVYADLTNITNQPLRYYQQTANRTMQAEYYGSRFNIGIKYDLFR